jgi:hypothetical protein
MQNQFGSGESGAASVASSSSSFGVGSSPLSSLPEVLSDRATGGSLTVPKVVGFLEAEFGTRVHRATVWRWVLTGRLASYRVGGKVQTTKRAVLAMLEADAKGGARARRRDDAQLREVERAGAEAAARIAGSEA